MRWRWGGWRVLACAVAMSVTAIAVGVYAGAPADTPVPALSARLASVDTTTASVSRAPFCSRIARRDVRRALGGAAESTETWSNGDAVTLGSRSDVAHEYGCRWTGSGQRVSAWVFASPVTVDRAATYVIAASGTDGCASIAGAAAFGSPSVALTCPEETAGDGTTETSYRGLFGDAWLVCTATDAAIADRWCAAVLGAASGS
ncbi:MAG: hypothetical protein QM572_14385 [Nocardioides sp.]|uniref:hypothetical protein n=1 Tax=Nocardioides sp. TaxID=35761 RepID=UPI0039E6FC33